MVEIIALGMVIRLSNCTANMESVLSHAAKVNVLLRFWQILPAFLEHHRCVNPVRHLASTLRDWGLRWPASNTRR